MAGTFLGKLKRGLFMTHTEFLEKAGETFRREGPVATANLDRLEEALIAADAGVELSLSLDSGELVALVGSRIAHDLASPIGAIAPARMNGLMIVAWLWVAYTSAAASIVASHTIGDEALIRLVRTVRSSRSPPKAIRASSTESAARSPAVTDPISGLSL